MRKNFRVSMTSWVMVFLVVCVGTSLTAQAKPKRASSSKKQSSRKQAAKNRTIVKINQASKIAPGKGSNKIAAKTSSRGQKAQAEVQAVRRGKFGKPIREEAVADNSRASRSNRNGRLSRAESSLNNKQAQSLLSKRGKLTKAERRTLASYGSSRRARARAIQLARLRAVRAHDDALHNITAANIEKDNSAGEDLEIRHAAIGALQGRSGTVVVMDPNTGRVYTIVNQQMAVSSPVKPCSTVKLITSLAALHEGVFDPNQDMRSAKYGTLNLTDAIAHSDNSFFDVLGRFLGYDRVVKYAGNFGFGQKTGVNYPGESNGFLPEEESGRMCSFGDGFGVTAIQLATFTAAIANGGTLYTPHVPRSAEEAENFLPEVKHRIQMSQEDRTRLMSGMIGAVNYGTAKRAFNPLGQVAGKTGTCTGNSDKLRLFTSFSSVDNPRLVVTVITTDSKLGGYHASDVAGRVYAAIAPRFFHERTITSSSTGTESPATVGKAMSYQQK
ncbi:MAG: penicillin-binding transpeptidase domain-containing protein [Blastocatellia bacterium]